jgi:hypothetical protein
MPKKLIETVTLQPMSPIISFDAISYRASGTFTGSIGHFKYPDKKEYDAKKKAFYNSAIGHKNKQKIAELISEIYAYLNARISDHAETSDYYFRIYLRLEVNKETAEIVGTPSFDVDLFRHIGKIGGKHANAGKYVMQVVIVDKDRFPLSSIFKKGINKIKQDVGSGFMDFKIYSSYEKAPVSIQGLISKDTYFLIIDNEAHEIIPEIDSKTHDFSYFTQDNNKRIDFRSEDDVIAYILKKTKATPKIIGSETGFSLVDKEINEIANEFQKGKNEVKVNLIEQLGVDRTLTQLRDKLGIVKARANSERAKLRDKYSANLDEIEKKYNALKIEFEVQEGELNHCEDQHDKVEITDENYRVLRVRVIKAMKTIQLQLINLQKELKEKTSKEIENLEKTQPKGER